MPNKPMRNATVVSPPPTPPASRKTTSERSSSPTPMPNTPATLGCLPNRLPLIETPQAIRYLFEIAEHPKVVGFEFGAEDFTTEIGGLHTDERTEILYARQKVVAAAAAGDIDALDMAWPDFNDPEGLRRNAEQAVEMGFDGKSAIHPVQIEVIRDVFTPDPERVAWAERIVEEAAAARERGKVVFQLDGEMIDPPIIDRAEDILERAAAVE